ncbi:MAG: CopD family protein [Burkholderiales bacterium]|nr:CopD family protein [Burkholderiales bacterium]
MPWLMAAHIGSLALWCAGLFLLPGLFAAHAGVEDPAAFKRLRTMSRFTYIAIASPGAVLTIVSGTALVAVSDLLGDWLVLKLTLVTAMTGFHVYCGRLLRLLGMHPGLRAPRWLRLLTLVPALLVPLVLWTVLDKPALLARAV